ncbi:MAG: hypothetical protein J7J92_01930 [Candidatus Aenigmarchaeota archaeon]|nr:hypothetical protein [Candidatus Aenigmarchaeota archaeon]
MQARSIRFVKKLEGNVDDYVAEAINFIQKNVGPEEKVICALSGGVDSSVVAGLFTRAIGKRLHLIHIDTGFMRSINGKYESEIIKERFKDVENFEVVNKREMFYDRIFGIKDAEEKRKAFRKTYEDVINEKIEEIGASLATQGTIRPDIEETEGNIKSQNNVDTIFNVNRLVEPIAGLYKPDVRIVAKKLGLETYMRQPFPGPGLSVRTVGEIDAEKLKNERVANDITERFIENYFMSLYGKECLFEPVKGNRIPFQYFAGTFDSDMDIVPEVKKYLEKMGLKNVFPFVLRNKTTGVKEVKEEDEKIRRERIYSHPILLRGCLDSVMLKKLGEKIPENFEYSRVFYEVFDRPDNLIGDYLVAIRAVDSEDALYAQPLSIPLSQLTSLGEKIIKKTDVGIVAYDITPKPPATIEYE